MSRGFLGSGTVLQEFKKMYRCIIYLFHSSENRIKMGSSPSYTSIRHESTLNISALSQLISFIVFIFKVPYKKKKKKKSCWHAHSLPHSLSVEPTDSPRAADGASLAGWIVGRVQLIVCTFVHCIMLCWFWICARII